MSGQHSSRISTEFKAVFWLTAAMLVGLLFVGCGSGDKPESANQKKLSPVAASQTAVEQNTGIAPDQLLVGTWLGGAYLDAARLQTVLQDKDETARNLLTRQANSFLTTIMAIDLRQDGTMENEIEIMPPGEQPIRESSSGRWKVVEFESSRVVIEMTERLPDGSMESTRKICKLYEDGDHFAISVPLQSELTDCNPLIVFERQEMGPTALAENVDQNQTK